MVKLPSASATSPFSPYYKASYKVHKFYQQSQWATTPSLLKKDFWELFSEIKWRER